MLGKSTLLRSEVSEGGTEIINTILGLGLDAVKLA